MKILYSGPTSLCLELENDEPYYAPGKFDVFVDGKGYKSFGSNVFSVFGLAPGREYLIGIKAASGFAEEVTVVTAGETCCINVKDMGAAGDGVTDDSEALQNAVRLLPEGGRLFFPEGDYLTRPLTLKSRITLELGFGARLVGSTERERYPILPGVVRDMDGGSDIPFGGFEGQEIPFYQALLYASRAEDIAIVGEGIVDGQGDKGDWWKDFRSFPAARPRVLMLNRCSRVTVHGVTFMNGPAWHIHPFYSDHTAFYDVRVSAPKVSPNTDAIDAESSDYVEIIGCRLSVGDDCIAIKSGRMELGNKYKRPADHHVIRNCLMQYGHGAVTLGSEIGAGVAGIEVSKCFFCETDRGLRVKTRRGRGRNSVVKAVEFKNIRMDKVLTPIVINMWYNCADEDRHSEYVWTREKLPVDGRTPSLGSFTFRNVVCTDAEVAACYADGLPESPIGEVILEDVSIGMSRDAKPGIPAMKEFAKEELKLGLYFENVSKVRIKNVSLEGVEEDKALIAGHCGDVRTEGLSVKT